MPEVLTTLGGRSVGIGGLIANRYRIAGILGAGGMGAVYRAHDVELEEDVALKILSAVSENTLARFRREVKLARRVTHANVARTYDLGVHEDARFLTMELIEGISLDKRRDSGPVPLGEALRIVAEIARGLVAAHSVGVVHRDLKPQNIMLAAERVVITDFGVARLAEVSAATQLTREGLVGTPAYMAPEQVEGGSIEGRADVFALGIVLFELLTAQLPFGGDNAISMALSRLTTKAPTLRGLRDVPDGVARLVADALQRRVDDRPDAVTFLERLEAARGRAAPQQRFSSIMIEPTSADGPKTVVVRPFEGQGEAAGLAHDLASVVADALALVKRVRVVPPNYFESEVGITIEGSVRVAAGAARVRLRIVDAGQSTQLWSASIDGSLAEIFTLEDRVTASTVEAVQAHVAQSSRGAPADPELREMFERARAAYERFALPHVRESIQLCEQILIKQPGEPHTMAQLAASLIRMWAQTGGTNSAMAARAEEMALRAIAADPTLPDAHHVVALLRLITGELRAALAAEEETLRLMPLHGGAHKEIGRLLCESGRVEEGLRRLELASRLQPADTTVAFERARTHALLGRRDLADAILDDARSRGGELSTLIMDTRFAIWFGDVELAARCAATIRSQSTGAAWEESLALMDAIVSGQPAPNAVEIFTRLTSQMTAPRHRSLMFAIAAEYWARMDIPSMALDALEESTRLPFTDLLWLEHCPALASIRNEPRFAVVRSLASARVAELWS